MQLLSPACFGYVYLVFSHVHIFELGEMQTNYVVQFIRRIYVVHSIRVVWTFLNKWIPLQIGKQYFNHCLQPPSLHSKHFSSISRSSSVSVYLFNMHNLAPIQSEWFRTVENVINEVNCTEVGMQRRWRIVVCGMSSSILQIKRLLAIANMKMRRSIRMKYIKRRCDEQPKVTQNQPNYSTNNHKSGQ